MSRSALFALLLLPLSLPAAAQDEDADVVEGAEDINDVPDDGAASDGESFFAGPWKARPYFTPGVSAAIYTSSVATDVGVNLNGQAGFRYWQEDGMLQGRTRVAGSYIYTTGGTGTDVRLGSFMGVRPKLAGAEIGVDVAPWLVADPPLLDFGRLYLAGPVEATTVVRAAGGESFALDVGLIGEVVGGVLLRLEPAEGAATEGERATAWSVTVSLDPEVLAAPGGPLAQVDAAASRGGTPLIQRLLLTSDRPLERAGPVDPETPTTHFLDLALRASLLAPVQSSTGYLSFGFLAPGSAAAASARIECFAPELVEAFSAAPPTVRIEDADGATPDWAGQFVPTLRPVRPDQPGTRPLTPGALFAWDLEVLGKGFRGGDKNRVTGRVVVDFGQDGAEAPEGAIVVFAFGAIPDALKQEFLGGVVGALGAEAPAHVLLTGVDRFLGSARASGFDARRAAWTGLAARVGLPADRVHLDLDP